MGGGTRRAPIRTPNGSPRTDLLELFFDLALVAGLAMTSRKMAADQSWIGIAQALLLLSTLFAVWVTTTLITDSYSPRRQPVPLLILGTMFGLMLMAAALPTAFGDHGLIFSGTWVAIFLVRGLALAWSLRGRPEQERPVRALIWDIGTGTLWVVGGLVADPGWRLGLWLAALTADYTAYGLRFPLPGRAPPPRYQVVPEHLAERYQQIYILSLGEAGPGQRPQPGPPTVHRGSGGRPSAPRSSRPWCSGGATPGEPARPCVPASSRRPTPPGWCRPTRTPTG